MKKVLLLIIATLTFGFATQAQSTFSKGTTILSLDLGVGGTIIDGDYSILLPPLALALDHSMVGGLFDGNGSIGLGGYLGSEVARIKGFNNSIVSNTFIGPRGSLHYQFVDKLDTYFALMLGVRIGSVDYSAPVAGINSRSTKAVFDWGAHIGTRYYLSDKWAIMGELGYGMAFFSVGATYRF